MNHKSIALGLTALLLAVSLFQCPIEARGYSGDYSRGTYCSTINIMSTYMDMTQDFMEYSKLRPLASSPSTSMELEQRKLLVEKLISINGRICGNLSLLKTATNNETSKRQLDALMIRANAKLAYITGQRYYVNAIMPSSQSLKADLEDLYLYFSDDAKTLIDFAVMLNEKSVAASHMGIYSNSAEYRFSLEQSFARQKTAPVVSTLPYLGLAHAQILAPMTYVKHDSDEDGISDEIEEDVLETDPNSTDSDKDGTSDLDELIEGKNPNLDENNLSKNPFYSPDQDSDCDGISDSDEAEIGTDMILRDSDRDGILDGDEVLLGYDPLSRDTDGDGSHDLEDLYPLDPSRGKGGIDIHDQEEVFATIYGSIAVGATIASFFGCTSCPSIAFKAAYEAFELYQAEMRERELGCDD